jgi:hypothetical protein
MPVPFRFLPRAPRSFAAAILLAFAALGVVPDPANALETHDLCANALVRTERANNIPSSLMSAIATVESGRWSAERKEVVAWPWTVTNGPDGQYFPTKEAAIAHVEKLRAHGVRNIDVGCMQVNLKYHPDAFENLETAFDPAANAAYAARFLTGLFSAHKSWGEAIRHYHSANAIYNQPYHRKVVRAWNSQRRTSAEAHRQAVIAEHLARREALRAERARQLAALR